MKTFSPRFYSITALIFAGALTRLLPHPANFAAVAGIALFAGAQFTDKRWAFVIPIAALLFSNLFLPGGGLQETPVFVCMLVATAIGILVGKNITVLNVVGGSLASSLIFYLITNLPFWYGNLGLYSNDMNGLLQSYTAALPFFRNSLIGDLFYSGACFGVFYALEKRFPVLALK